MEKGFTFSLKLIQLYPNVDEHFMHPESIAFLHLPYTQHDRFLFDILLPIIKVIEPYRLDGH